MLINAGVVYEPVDPVVIRRHKLLKRLPVVFGSHILLEICGAWNRFANHFFFDVCPDDLRSLFGQLSNDRKANASATTGYNDHFIF